MRYNNVGCFVRGILVVKGEILGTDDYQPLEHQINFFRQWANAYSIGPRSGEWECDYDNWAEVYTEFERFISRVPFKEWSQETIDDILYIIARDNEDEQLIDDLAKDPERLLFMSRASLSSAEYDARRQLADRLGNLTGRAAEAEDVLIQFIAGGQNESELNEYTSRRALMALGRLKSSTLEELVEGAWATGYLYQRMAVIGALYDAASPKLEEYLQLAEVENDQYLLHYAARVRADRPN